MKTKITILDMATEAALCLISICMEMNGDLNIREPTAGIACQFYEVPPKPFCVYLDNLVKCLKSSISLYTEVSVRLKQSHHCSHTLC